MRDGHTETVFEWGSYRPCAADKLSVKVTHWPQGQRLHLVDSLKLYGSVSNHLHVKPWIVFN